MKNLILVIPSLMILGACASTPKETSPAISNSAPDWVRHPEANYPETRYLVAVGTGSGREDAIQDAKKQMAEGFVVKVKSITQSTTNSSFNQSTSGSAGGDTSQNTSKEVSLESNTYLRGAQVKEVQTSGSDTYALLVLDKLSARSGLMLEANRLQTELSNQLDSLESHFSQEKLQSAKKSLAAFQELYGEAGALGMSALVDLNPSQSRLEKIENSARGRNEKLLFTVKTIQGETYFERDIEACINDRGGTVYDGEKAPEAAHQIRVSVIERPQHLPVEGWTKIRFDLTASVVASDGKLYRIQTTETETGRNRSAVLESVSDKLSKSLCEQLFSRMSEVK